jgi:hypothetical protein
MHLDIYYVYLEKLEWFIICNGWEYIFIISKKIEKEIELGQNSNDLGYMSVETIGNTLSQNLLIMMAHMYLSSS